MRLVTLLLGLAWLCTAAQADEACLKCHASAAELRKAAKDGQRPLAPLLVDAALHQASVHASQGCTDCHLDFESHPHSSEAETVGCAECHEDAADVFAKSVHGKQGADQLPVKCSSCHGAHDVMKASERQSRLHPLNVARTCGACHFDIDAETATVEELLQQSYTDDTHATGLLRSGLVVSATCISCHGGHEIRAQGDPESRVSRLNVENVCGSCHVGIVEAYAGSVHFTKLREEGHEGPACSDCHPPHAIERVDNGFRRDSHRACGKCHEGHMATFRRTHHGKLTDLGYSERVADCAACHGSHEIRSVSDPLSRIHADNRVETCAQCHANANPQFAAFHVHADPSNADEHPGLHFVEHSMKWLLTITFTLAGLHALLWLIRSLLAGERRIKAPPGGHRYIRRWPQFYVILHVVFMTAFVLLASTGLPIHYASKPWAAAIMRTFGGPVVASWVHRVAAIIMLSCMAAYVGQILYRWLVKREKGLWMGPNSMVPRWKDAQDLAGNVRWFLGRGPKPRFDRWTYWEKFDFWAVFWGVVIIGGSGVVLWFPEAATRVLPGWALNVAVIVHGHEALLAVGFIFTIHIFHANLRPDKFPMDPLFYTGRIPEAEFREERPLELERAVREGTLESFYDREPQYRTRRRAYIWGLLVMTIGVLLTIFMVFALAG